MCVRVCVCICMWLCVWMWCGCAVSVVGSDVCLPLYACVYEFPTCVTCVNNHEEVVFLVTLSSNNNMQSLVVILCLYLCLCLCLSWWRELQQLRPITIYRVWLWYCVYVCVYVCIGGGNCNSCNAPRALDSSLRYLIGSQHLSRCHGVASISKLLEIIGLFCKRALQKRRYSTKRTYNFEEPANRSQPIHMYGLPGWIMIAPPTSPWCPRLGSIKQIWNWNDAFSRSRAQEIGLSLFMIYPALWNNTQLLPANGYMYGGVAMICRLLKIIGLFYKRAP